MTLHQLFYAGELVELYHYLLVFSDLRWGCLLSASDFSTHIRQKPFILFFLKLDIRLSPD